MSYPPPPPPGYQPPPPGYQPPPPPGHQPPPPPDYPVAPSGPPSRANRLLLAAAAVVVVGLVALVIVLAGVLRPAPEAGGPGRPTSPIGVTTPSAVPTDARPTVQPQVGHAVGTVTYADGRPLAAATVNVTAAGYNIDLTATTGAGGTYAIALPEPSLRYSIVAWIETSYAGQAYYFPLEPVGGRTAEFGGEGVTQDFRWGLVGPAWWAPGESIGPSIAIYGYDPLADPTAERPLDAAIGAQIRLQLEPLDPLVDGSAGQPVTLTAAVTRGPGRFDFTPLAVTGDVPVGRYRAAAELLSADGSAAPLLVTASCARGGLPQCPIPPPPLSATAELNFPPVDVRTNPRPYQGTPAADADVYVVAGE